MQPEWIYRFAQDLMERLDMSQRTADELFRPTGKKGAWQREWPVTKRHKTSKQNHVKQPNFLDTHTRLYGYLCGAFTLTSIHLYSLSQTLTLTLTLTNLCLSLTSVHILPKNFSLHPKINVKVVGSKILSTQRLSDPTLSVKIQVSDPTNTETNTHTHTH